MNQELSTMADRLGVDTAQLSSGAQATTSILTEYFNAGFENGEAHVTNFCTKLHYIKQTLELEPQMMMMMMTTTVRLTMEKGKREKRVQ